MNNHLRKLQCFFAFFVFLLSSLIIFNPLYASDTPLVSLFAFLVTGTVLISAICAVYKKTKSKALPAFMHIIFSILCCVLSVFLTLIMLTQVIKETSYIANRNISMFYYMLFTVFVLMAGFYLCTRGFKGIYRFSIICFVFFALLLIASLTVFFSTKGIVKQSILSPIEKVTAKDLLAGFKAGVFVSLDSIFFIFCFEEYLIDGKQKLYRHVLLSAFFACFAFFGTIYIIMLLTFGKDIVQQLRYPVFSLLKLVYAVDAVDLLSFTLIPAYMIKSSVYIYSSGICLNKALSKDKNNTKKIIASLHLCIPVILSFIAIFFNNLPYGAFQHTVYIINAILCLLFIFVITEKKKH